MAAPTELFLWLLPPRKSAFVLSKKCLIMVLSKRKTPSSNSGRLRENRFWMSMNYHHALNNRTKDHIMNKSEQKLLRLIRYFMANLTLVALALITFASCQKSDSPVNQVISLADRNYTFSNGVVPRNIRKSIVKGKSVSVRVDLG